MVKATTSNQRGLVEGYRSGLEDKVGQQIDSLGLPVAYEAAKIKYTPPTKVRSYSPDFVLPNGIIIETKGRFVTADRQKHKHIADQYPELDLRFVFSNSRNRISKTSATTYAKWCEDHGFQYADKLIPVEWVMEGPNVYRIMALEKATGKTLKEILTGN